MRVLSPGELAGKIYFMLRCLDLMNQIMKAHRQLRGGTPWYKRTLSVLYAEGLEHLWQVI